MPSQEQIKSIAEKLLNEGKSKGLSGRKLKRWFERKARKVKIGQK